MRAPSICFSLCLAAAPCAPACAESFSVPFELERNRVVIAATINGSRPLRLVLDTGMVNGVLLRQPDVAAEIGLESSRKIKVDGAGTESPVEADVAFGATIAIGGTLLRWQPVVIMPGHSTYSKTSRHLRADGLVGHSLFSQFAVEIDHDTRRVTFHPRDADLATDGATVLPITVEDHKPYVMGKVALDDGTSLNLKLFVDTGASACFLLNPESHDSIKPPRRSVEATLGRGVVGKRRGLVGRVPSLRLGAIEIDNVVTGFPHARMRGLSTDRHGLIGNDLLNRFNVVFDYRRSRMILRPNSGMKRPIEYDMVGLQFDARLDAGEPFTIDEVLADSPAMRAGIRLGDILTAVDGQPATDLGLTRVEQMFRTGVGDEYRLDLRRGDELVSVRVRLRRLI